MTNRTSPFGNAIQSALQAFMMIRDLQLSQDREKRLQENAEATRELEGRRLDLDAAREQRLTDLALRDQDLQELGLAHQLTPPNAEVPMEIVKKALGTPFQAAFRGQTSLPATAMPGTPEIAPPSEFGIRLPTFAEQQSLDELKRVQDAKAKALALIQSIPNAKQRELAGAAIETGQNLPANLFEDPEADWAKDKRRMDYQARLTRDTQAMNREGRYVRVTEFDPQTNRTIERFIPVEEAAAADGFRKAPPPGFQTRLSYMRSASRIVNQLKELSKEINTLEGAAAVAKGAVEEQKAKLNLNHALRRYQGLIEANLPTFARAKGEVGNMAEQEQWRQKMGLPDAKTARSLAIKMFEDYMKPMEDEAKSFGFELPAGGIEQKIVTAAEIATIARERGESPEQVRQAFIARGFEVR